MIRWVAGVLLLLLIALIFDLGLLAYAMYVLLAALAVSRFLTHTWATSLAAKRKVSGLKAKTGETVSIIIALENSGRMTIPWVLMEDVLPREAVMHDPPALGVTGNCLQLLSLTGGQKKSVMYQVRCNRRGYYQLGPLVLETGDLFGLDRRYQVATEPSFLLVMPKVLPLAGYEIASRRPIGEVRMTYRLFEDPTRIAGIRPYEQGDSLRRVHWSATARTGTLHSKVYEPSTISGATLLLDFHQQSFDKKNEPVRSELAITAIASIANALYQMGQQVGLVTNGRDAADRIRTEGWRADSRTREAALKRAQQEEKNDRLQPKQVKTGRGPETLRDLHELLARLELTDGLDLAALIIETAGRVPRDATLIALLTKGTVEQALALGILRRRGFSISVILNIYDDYDFSQIAIPFLAEGMEVRQLKDEETLAWLCQETALARI